MGYALKVALERLQERPDVARVMAESAAASREKDGGEADDISSGGPP